MVYSVSMTSVRAQPSNKTKLARSSVLHNLACWINQIQCAHHCEESQSAWAGHVGCSDQLSQLRSQLTADNHQVCEERHLQSPAHSHAQSPSRCSLCLRKF